MRDHDADDLDHDDDIPESGVDWRRAPGAFVLVPVLGPAGEALDAMRRTHDPKLANSNKPHLSLIGSSGAGPILPAHGDDAVREALGSVAGRIAPFEVRALRAMRFPGTEIVSFELDPHGPLRALHEAVKASGLRFGPVRFPFSPHLTINFYRTLDRAMERALLALTLDAPVVVDRLELSRTNDPEPPSAVFTLPLTGGAA